jgi:hypothetical protein
MWLRFIGVSARISEGLSDAIISNTMIFPDIAIAPPDHRSLPIHAVP